MAIPLVEGRSTGLAESSTLGMRGAAATGWNPALLGLRDSPQSSHILPSIAMRIGNNAFSMNYISDTFVRGKYLSDADIFDMLDRLEKDKLSINSVATLPLYRGASKGYSVNLFDVHFSASGVIPEDVFDLVFSGWEVGKRYDFTGIKEEMLAYWSSSLTVANDFDLSSIFSEFAMGATFKYIRGISYTRLNRSNGWFEVTEDTIHADGYFQHLNAESGGGVGLDLGVVARYEPWDAMLGFTLGNLIGNILWEDVTAGELYFERHAGLHPDSLLNEDYWKRFFNDHDTTFSYGAITTKLPKYFILAASKPNLFFDNTVSYFSWYQGLNRTPSHSTVPRISVGEEYYPIRDLLALRAGMALGGVEVFVLSGGVGIKLGNYHLDVGGSWQRGVFNGNKGFAIAITNSISID